MATKVKIVYNGPVVDIVRNGMEIARIFTPKASYIDSDVYVNGLSVEGSEAEEQVYGKSIYATNVDGWGRLPGLLPMAHTTVPFAQFERAVAVAAAAEAAGEENQGVEFEVEGYKEELYWNQMGDNMKDQGFEVTVGEANGEPDGEETDSE